jgi:hypothetical protein
LKIHFLGIKDNEDVAPPFERSPCRVALECTDLLNEDELLVGCSGDDMYIRVIAMQNFATGETGIAWIEWGNMWV